MFCYQHTCIHVQSVVEARDSLANELRVLKEKLVIVEEKLEFSESVVDERDSLASELSVLKEKLAIVEEELKFSEEVLEKWKVWDAMLVDENNDYMSKVPRTACSCIPITFNFSLSGFR